MKVNKTITIESGVIRETTNKIFKNLQEQGGVLVKENVRYDPLGIEIQLISDEEEFAVQEVSVGQRPPIINNEPVIWKWKVKPRKRGDYYLTLIAIVDLQVPELERNYVKEVVVDRTSVNIQGNLGYSTQQFFAKHWRKMLIVSISFFFGFFLWRMALRSRGKRQEILSSSDV